MADDLKARTAKGIGWGFTENILGSGIFGVANIILAHILSPEDFGIIGMTAIFSHYPILWLTVVLPMPLPVRKKLRPRIWIQCSILI